MNDPDDDPEIEETDEPEVIKVRVAGVDWQKGLANSSRIPDVTERLVRLPIPETRPDPNSMHIFVQFQVSDLIYKYHLNQIEMTWIIPAMSRRPFG